MCPNQEHVVNVPPPREWLLWMRLQKALFQATHEDICLGRGHSGPHGGAMYLQVVGAIESEIICIEDGVDKAAQIFCRRIWDGPGVEEIFTCLDAFLVGDVGIK